MGSPKSPNQVSVSFKKGIECLRNELLDEARNFFLEVIAISPHHQRALNLLGLINKKEGKYEEALQFFSRSVKFGNASAQFNIGLMYANGEHVEQSYVEAVRYYTLASSQGNNNALFNIAKIYLRGKPGVIQDKKRALKYFKAAHANGDKRAAFVLMFLDENTGNELKDKIESHEFGSQFEQLITGLDSNTPRKENGSDQNGKLKAKQHELLQKRDQLMNLIAQSDDSPRLSPRNNSDKFTPLPGEVEARVKLTLESKHKDELRKLETARIKQVESLRLQLQYERESKREQIQKLQDKYEADLSLKNSEIVRLRKGLNDKDTVNKGDMERMKNVIDELVSELDNEKVHAIELSTDMDKLEIKNRELQQMVDDLTSKLIRESKQTTLQAQLHSQSTESLSKESSTLKNQMKELLNQVKVLHQEKESSLSKFKALDDKYKSLHQEHEILQQEHEIYQKSVHELQGKLSNSETRHQQDILQTTKQHKLFVKQLQRELVEEKTKSKSDQKSMIENYFDSLLRNITQLKESQQTENDLVKETFKRLKGEFLNQFTESLEKQQLQFQQHQSHSSSFLDSVSKRMGNLENKSEQSRVIAETMNTNVLKELKNLRHDVFMLTNSEPIKVEDERLEKMEGKLNTLMKKFSPSKTPLKQSPLRSNLQKTHEIEEDAISVVSHRSTYSSKSNQEDKNDKTISFLKDKISMLTKAIENVSSPRMVFAEQLELSNQSMSELETKISNIETLMNQETQDLNDVSQEFNNSALSSKNYGMKNNSSTTSIAFEPSTIDKREEAVLIAQSLIISEFKNMEEVYSHDLKQLQQLYMRPLAARSDILSQATWFTIFSNFDSILVHVTEFTKEISKILIDYRLSNSNSNMNQLKRKHPSYSEPTIIQFMQAVYTYMMKINQVYSPYINGYSRMMERYRFERSAYNLSFREFCRHVSREQVHQRLHDLYNYLELPMKKLTHYIQLFEKLKRVTPPHHSTSPKLLVVLNLLKDTKKEFDKYIESTENEIVQKVSQGLNMPELAVTGSSRSFLGQFNVSVFYQDMQHDTDRHLADALQRYQQSQDGNYISLARKNDRYPSIGYIFSDILVMVLYKDLKLDQNDGENLLPSVSSNEYITYPHSDSILSIINIPLSEIPDHPETACDIKIDQKAIIFHFDRLYAQAFMYNKTLVSFFDSAVDTQERFQFLLSLMNKP